MTLTQIDVLYGAPIPAAARVRLMSPSDFELLVKEWVKVCSKAYLGHEHFGGAGDMGRDVAGWLDHKKCLGLWDNYQCKRLSDPLTATDVWPELGKIFWHVSLGDYVMPRSMRFFCSAGIGTRVKHLFANTDKLKEGLLKAWSTSVESKISTVPVPLSPQIAALINGTDFTIFGGLHVDEVLDAIRGTAFYITNFGGGFPQRPLATEPPPDISAHETRYTEKLFAVYGERLAKPVGNLADLTPNTFERRHFNQMRRQFYSAEALSEFVRELTEQGTFAHFQKDIFNAVVWPVFTDDYATSFQRLQKTLSCAAVIPQGSNAIYLVAEAIDKQGVCHQLANGDELDWDNP